MKKLNRPWVTLGAIIVAVGAVGVTARSGPEPSEVLQSGDGGGLEAVRVREAEGRESTEREAFQAWAAERQSLIELRSVATSEAEKEAISRQLRGLQAVWHESLGTFSGAAAGVTPGSGGSRSRLTPEERSAVVAREVRRNAREDRRLMIRQRIREMDQAKRRQLEVLRLEREAMWTERLAEERKQAVAASRKPPEGVARPKREAGTTP